jgi:hypothetical protein
LNSRKIICNGIVFFLYFFVLFHSELIGFVWVVARIYIWVFVGILWFDCVFTVKEVFYFDQKFEIGKNGKFLKLSKEYNINEFHVGFKSLRVCMAHNSTWMVYSVQIKLDKEVICLESHKGKPHPTADFCASVSYDKKHSIVSHRWAVGHTNSDWLEESESWTLNICCGFISPWNKLIKYSTTIHLSIISPVIGRYLWFEKS